MPAYLIGIITAIGLIALRRNAGQVVGGALKAAIGFLILGAGATVVTGALDPLGTLILAVTGAQGVIPTNEVIAAVAQEQYGAQSAYVLVLGFLVMLALARFTPLKYIFLTGHHMVFMSVLLTVVLSVGLGDGLSWLTVLLGAVLLGVIMVVMPAFAQPFMKKITGDDSIAMGHFGTLGYVAAASAGIAVGTKSKSTEEIKSPPGPEVPPRLDGRHEPLDGADLPGLHDLGPDQPAAGRGVRDLRRDRRGRVHHGRLRPGAAVRRRRRDHPLRRAHRARRARPRVPGHRREGRAGRQARARHPAGVPVRRQRRADRVPLVVRRRASSPSACSPRG